MIYMLVMFLDKCGYSWIYVMDVQNWKFVPFMFILNFFYIRMATPAYFMDSFLVLYSEVMSVFDVEMSFLNTPEC